MTHPTTSNKVADKVQQSELAETLYEHVTSEKNIYNAIYALESYIFEKGLLSESDLKEYVRLGDKYDFDHIGKLIEKCKGRLTELLSSPEKLFDVEVYFRIKKMEEGKMVYRPMHTASLVDQICMVCLLFPIAFEDKVTRKKSELVKLIPHNFYGNIPSLDPSHLFIPWQKQYKEYSDSIVTKCRDYQKSRKYKTEVSLDIANFFPTISPFFIFNFIYHKLEMTYPKQEDKQTLKAILSKLLFFKIKEGCLDSWEKEYYGKSDIGSYRLAKGIPQGLPQSYLFGNICMMHIKDIINHRDIFGGDAYYYVDDSVIYVQPEFSNNPEDFVRRIQALNQQLEKWKDDKAWKELDDDISKFLSPATLTFHRNMDYQVKYHEGGKSSFTPIEEADTELMVFPDLHRGVSKCGSLALNLDEVDDQISEKKFRAYADVVGHEIDRLKDKGKKAPIKEGQLKLLRRLKRFFLFRQRLMQFRTEGSIKPKFVDDFKTRFKIDNKKFDPKEVEEWFEINDEDIFKSEADLIIQNYAHNEAKGFVNKLIEFECRFTKASKSQARHLYYQKSFSASLALKGLIAEPYYSLRIWARINHKSARFSSDFNRIEKLRDFIKGELLKIQTEGFDEAPYVKFIGSNCEDFKRKVLNAYFSEMTGVDTSDQTAFVKNSARIMTYTELRILAYLRNRRFKLEDFATFLNSIDPMDTANHMGIDLGLMEVLGIFIKKVSTPAWVDSLIVTHRLVKGLWYNGSKFLHSYTLHNEEHAVALVKSALKITRDIDYFSLKGTDFYILFLACYLHDISMVLHPEIHSLKHDFFKNQKIITNFIKSLHSRIKKIDAVDYDDENNLRLKEAGDLMIEAFDEVYNFFENSVRTSHPRESAAWIRKHASKYLVGISHTMLEYVARVAESHGAESENVYGMKSKATDELVSEKYLMVVIRLADLLDVGCDRVNYFFLRQNLRHLPLISRFHWISHLTTEDMRLETDYKVAKEASLSQHPITERLNFNLYLKVKYLSSFAEDKHPHCKHCKFAYPFKKDEVPLLHERENYDGISLLIGEENCTENNCCFICRWATKKHEWFIQELYELNRYLALVNSSLIRTEIRFNILFSDTYNLEPDFFDEVKNYLEGRDDF